MTKLSAVLNYIRREILLDQEEECRKIGDFYTVNVLETEIDNYYEDEFSNEELCEVIEEHLELFREEN